DAKLETARIVGSDERPRTRELLHAVVPEREAENAALRERREQLVTLRARLEALDGCEVRKQKRQIEDLKLLREAVVERYRRRDHLHLAERERLDRLRVLHELRRRIDLDAHAARETLLRELLEALRHLPLRRGGCHDVRKLDDIRRCLRSRSRGLAGRR